MPPLKPAPVPSSFTPAAAAAAIAAVGAVAVVAAAVPAAVGAAGGSAASASSAAASGTAMSVMITHLQSAALVSNLDGVKWKGAMRKFVDKLQTVNFRFGNTTTPAPTPRVVVNKGSWHAEKYGFEAGLEGETKSSKKPLAKDLENMLLVLIGLFVLSFVIWGSVVGWRRCRGRYAGESDSVHVLTLAVLVFITDKAFQPLVSHATKQIVFTAAGDSHDDGGTVFLAVAVLLLVLSSAFLATFSFMSLILATRSADFFFSPSTSPSKAGMVGFSSSISLVCSSISAVTDATIDSEFPPVRQYYDGPQDIHQKKHHVGGRAGGGRGTCLLQLVLSARDQSKCLLQPFFLV